MDWTFAVLLTLVNELGFERKAEPVTCGIPLAAGSGSASRDFALLGSDGRAVPAQILVTNRFKDGAPRWVLIDFQADLPAKGKAVYRLASGRAAGSSSSRMAAPRPWDRPS